MKNRFRAESFEGEIAKSWHSVLVEETGTVHSCLEGHCLDSVGLPYRTVLGLFADFVRRTAQNIQLAEGNTFRLGQSRGLRMVLMLQFQC